MAKEYARYSVTINSRPDKEKVTQLRLLPGDKLKIKCLVNNEEVSEYFYTVSGAEELRNERKPVVAELGIVDLTVVPIGHDNPNDCDNYTAVKEKKEVKEVDE